MMNKIIYIHCPDCGGIIETPEEENYYSSSIYIYKTNEMPRCKECGTRYKIMIHAKGIMKIVLERAY